MGPGVNKPRENNPRQWIPNQETKRNVSEPVHQFKSSESQIQQRRELHTADFQRRNFTAGRDTTTYEKERGFESLNNARLSAPQPKSTEYRPRPVDVSGRVGPSRAEVDRSAQSNADTRFQLVSGHHTSSDQSIYKKNRCRIIIFAWSLLPRPPRAQNNSLRHRNAAQGGQDGAEPAHPRQPEDLGELERPGGGQRRPGRGRRRPGWRRAQPRWDIRSCCSPSHSQDPSLHCDGSARQARRRPM